MPMDGMRGDIEGAICLLNLVLFHIHVRSGTQIVVADSQVVT